MRHILILKLGIMAMVIGCASEPVLPAVPPPRSWSPADYGSDYRPTGWVLPKQLSGDPPTLAGPCMPPHSAGIVNIRCRIGVDGVMSECKVLNPIAGCEQDVADLAQTYENTYRYRPPLWNGRPSEVPYTYHLHVLGKDVRRAPARPWSRPSQNLPASGEGVQPVELVGHPKQIAGSPPSFHQRGEICVPPGTAAMLKFLCTIGVDGAVSNCLLFPPRVPVGCDEALANAITTLEDTYRFRPVYRDGQPVAVSHFFTFELLGAGVRPAPRASVPAKEPEKQP